MWLLDHNFPVQIQEYLIEHGVACQTTKYHGWEFLRNGVLAATAYTGGYRTILTRDTSFGESAAKALQQHQELAIVIVVLKQAKAPNYVAAFNSAWQQSKIIPVPGKLVRWPS